MTLKEGGIRVPAIVRWPGMVPAGGMTEQAAITMDWTATILAATGTQADSAYHLDGQNLLPIYGSAHAVRSRAVLANHYGRRGASDPGSI